MDPWGRCEEREYSAQNLKKKKKGERDWKYVFDGDLGDEML